MYEVLSVHINWLMIDSGLISATKQPRRWLRIWGGYTAQHVLARQNVRKTMHVRLAMQLSLHCVCTRSLHALGRGTSIKYYDVDTRWSWFAFLSLSSYLSLQCTNAVIYSGTQDLTPWIIILHHTFTAIPSSIVLTNSRIKKVLLVVSNQTAHVTWSAISFIFI
jgi:hypothetical protein